MKVSDLKNNPDNPRIIKDAAFEKLKKSIKEFPQMMELRPMVIDSEGFVLGGNMRLQAIKDLKMKEIPDSWVKRADDLTEEQKREFVIKDNSGFGEWDWDAIANEWSDLPLTDWGLEIPEIVAIDAEEESKDAEPQIDKAAELNKKWKVKSGDLWQIGEHRLLCGDSTDYAHIARLMDGEKADLIHADPPYGMGKESDGVANDNLYDEKLDAFQMAWWGAVRDYATANASVYIWGNAPDLWRLWYLGGLNTSERLTLRNEIVWDKKNIPGMASDEMRSYPGVTERALFFMRGEQGFNNNADNYWDGWESIRSYLETEMKRCGWKMSDLNRITGTQMAGHWVTKSQWMLITEEHYKKIQDAARKHDAFKREHDELKREHDELKREFYATRAYFDNAHEIMTDVWDFPRVTGDERHGHATPKPVAMMERIMKSSLPKGGLCIEPFGGSGSTMVGAQNTGRRCNVLELQGDYCAVILERMQTAFPELEIKRIDG